MGLLPWPLYLLVLTVKQAHIRQMSDIPENPEGARPKQGPDGRWLKGQSGNPNGRVKGAKYAEIRRLLNENAVDVAQSLINAALKGDTQAGKFILERMVAIKKTNPVMFPMPPVKDAESAKVAVSTIIEAQSTGELTPDEAESLLKSVNAFIAIVEIASFERRLAALEDRQ